MKLLETISLSIGYSPDKPLQREVNFQVRKGEIISLMGQNGVGKTTFIKTVCGLLPPLGGDVYFGAENLKTIPKNALARKLSVVLTEKPYSMNISVIELIAIGRHPYSNWMGVLSKEDKDAIDRAIDETHINYLTHRKLFELSDGQLQKVMIARALAQETDLIILDEPTAHLDLNNKLEVMFLLRKIAGMGKGVIISTHDLQLSTQLSDRLWLFNFNEPVQEGVPEDLILNHTLERTLYLHDFGYDMIHGVVQFPATKFAIAVQGPEDLKFWTEQALKRVGYRIATGADATVRIEIKDKEWSVRLGKTDFTFQTIESLLAGLEMHKH